MATHVKGTFVYFLGIAVLFMFFKDFNPESKECNNLEEGTRNKSTSCSYSEMERAPVSRKRKKRARSHLHDSHNSASSLDKSTEYKVSRYLNAIGNNFVL